MRSQLLFFFIGILLHTCVDAQFFPPHHYPQHYFQWPTNAKIGIVANFGELRPNHYHMGLDVRTDSKENMNVLAAAEGYVAKVHIDATGFGRALYINHPNGFTTLYAHLNDFNPEIEQYVKEQQYRLKKWNIDLEIPAGILPVKKGAFIAYSGNTGGSQGPHIHFEIRETATEKVLNPLLFGMPIPDRQAPDLIRLAIYDRSISTLEQTPKIMMLRKSNGVYTIPGGHTHFNASKVSFAITAFDRYTGSTNQNGIFSSVVYDNDEPIAGFELNNISYDETRTLNGHIDYRLKAHGGPYVQHVSPLPGCMDVIYKTKPGSHGIIDLSDNEKHAITIDVKDVAGNTAVIKFSISGSNQPNVVISKTNYFEPDMLNIADEENIQFHMPEGCLFDAFHFNLQKNGNAYMLEGDDIPVNSYFSVSIRQQTDISDTGKMIMKMKTREKERFKKAVYVNGYFKASFRDLGTAELIMDHTPPAVVPLFGFHDGMHLKKNIIAFSVTDNTKEIGEFNAYLDGQWLLFSNDKSRSFIYKVDKYCPPGEHILQLIVKDLAGNTTEKNYHFYR